MTLRSRDEAEQLFHDNKGLVYAALRRFGWLAGSRDPASDDMEQAALMAAWRACLEYDPARTMISTFVTVYVHNGLIKHRARTQQRDIAGGMRWRPEGRTVARCVIDYNDADPWSGSDIDAIDDRDEFEVRLAQVHHAATRIPVRSDRQGTVFALVLAGRSNDEIMQATGENRKRVKNVRNWFISRVRDELGIKATGGAA